MEQIVDFSPGAKQSMQASLYFADVASDWLEVALPAGEPRQMLILETGSGVLLLRLWSSIPNVQGQELADFAEWLRTIKDEVTGLGREPDNARAIEVARTWVETRTGKGDFFLEVLNPDTGFSKDEEADLSVGVVADEVVLISARNLIFTKLASGLFGLSVHSLGSWLFGKDGTSTRQHTA